MDLTRGHVGLVCGLARVSSPYFRNPYLTVLSSVVWKEKSYLVWCFISERGENKLGVFIVFVGGDSQRVFVLSTEPFFVTHRAVWSSIGKITGYHII